MSISTPPARQLTGLFSAAHARYCDTVSALLTPTVAASPLPLALCGLVAAYLVPDRCEFSQLALVPAMDDDSEFDDWFLEWQGSYLILSHPVREYDFVYNSGDEVARFTDNFIDEAELDDLLSLSARAHDPYIDDISSAELAALLADLLEYRFDLLMEAPLSEVWPRLSTLGLC